MKKILLILTFLLAYSLQGDGQVVIEKNQARAYLKIGERLYTEGTIHKRDLKFIESCFVKYDNQPEKEVKVYGFRLSVVDENGDFRSCKIVGGKVDQKAIDKISRLANPIKIYIDEIKWRPIGCFEPMGSIVLTIRPD